jgi:hypothetical protein
MLQRQLSLFALPFPKRATFRMESVRFSLLPAELQVMAVAAMDSGARIADWVSVFNTSKAMRAAAEMAFGDWVAAQPDGAGFGEFSNAEAELEFVMDHAPSKKLLSA